MPVPSVVVRGLLFPDVGYWDLEKVVPPARVKSLCEDFYVVNTFGPFFALYYPNLGVHKDWGGPACSLGPNQVSQLTCPPTGSRLPGES